MANNERTVSDLTYKPITLLLILSLGRSGSTFLAREISRSTHYANGGENRFFWQELLKKPQYLHAKEISEYFCQKSPNTDFFIDKTPALCNFVRLVNFGEHTVYWIALVRDLGEIEISRKKFLSALRRPKRILMRIRKYKSDYGPRWYIPILQKWHFILGVVGLSRNLLFKTSALSKTILEEKEELNDAIAFLSSNTRGIVVEYNNFHQSIKELRSMDFTEKQIHNIASQFNR